MGFDLTSLLSIGSTLVGVIGNLARNAQAVQAEAELRSLNQATEEKARKVQLLQQEVQALQNQLSSIASSVKESNIASYAPYLSLIAGVAIGWVVMK